jgi:hypothetical protein
MLPLLALALSAAVQAQSPTATVWGQVRSASSGIPIAYAVVEVVGTGADRMAVTTDENGVYVLTRVPPGRRTIRASHIDHAAHQVVVDLGAASKLGIDFDLQLRPVRLPTVLARGRAIEAGLRDTISVRPADLGSAAVRALEATPGVAELGLAEAVREVPGHEPIDPSDVLFVRGAAADLKLVLLNGAPVFAPFHVGGLISALDTELYRSARIQMGGAPARYDGGLSYVMDLETRSGRETGLHGLAGVDLLSARGVVEGPIAGGLTFLVAGRGVHGMGAEPFVGSPFPYEYGDGVARIDVDLGARRAFSATGFFNREAVRLDSLRGVDPAASWGNAAGSVRYRGMFAGADALVTVGAGTYHTRLPIGGLPALLTEGSARRARAAVDLVRAVGWARLAFGASFDRLEYAQEVWSEQGTDSDSLVFESKTTGNAGGGYVDFEVNPVARLRVRAGLRADRYGAQPEMLLAPRLSLTLLLTDHAALTVAGGRYHQYVRATEEPFAILGALVPTPGEEQRLAVASADHFQVGLDQEFGEGVRLSLEGFYKSFNGLPSVPRSRAEASGVDVWLRGSRAGMLGWLGYSLAWVWSDENDALSPTHLFDGRRLLTAGLGGPLIGKGRFDVRIAYGSGLPFAAIPEPEAASPVLGVSRTDPVSLAAMVPTPSIPQPPDQPYVRLDAQLARTWEGAWRGFEFEVTPYVRVLNALNRRDGIFYYYDRGAGAEARALAGLPVLPIVGLDWRF